MRLLGAVLLASLALACTSGVEPEPATTPPAAATAEPSDATGGPSEPDRPPESPPGTRVNRLPTPSNEAGPVTIAVVGDLMFAREVTTLMEEHGVEYPFERVSHLWRDAGVVIGNLEGTFTDRGEARAKAYTFRTPPGLATTLSEAGFDAVSLANNHAYDFGEQGLEDTIDALDAIGVQGFGAALDGHGASNPAIVELPGMTLALLVFTAVAEREASPPRTPGVAWGDVEAVRAAVAERADLGETVIVMLHAGDEYVREPSETQTALARAAIDAGAKVVIGTHPHVLQPWERYGDGVILYSLGNFVFDLDRDDLATLGAGPFQTAVALVTIDADGGVDVRFRPAYIDPDENRPRPATDEESTEILRLLGEG